MSKGERNRVKIRVRTAMAAQAKDEGRFLGGRPPCGYLIVDAGQCGLCGRRMQGHWVNDAPYYRCRFPADYALANRVEHPLSVYLREAVIIGEVDRWLAREFAPHRLSETIRDLAAAWQGGATRTSDQEEVARKIAECDRKLGQYRAALDAGASPATVAGWIAETEAERARYEVGLRQVATATRHRMTEAEIKSIVSKLADIARVLSDADPDDKSEIFRQLGLKLTYHPGRRLVEARVEPSPYGFFEGVRGGT
jgi:site-specific DNA recombinase